MTDELARIAATYRRNLPPEGKARTFAYGGLDRLGVPVVAASFAFDDGYHFDGYGYGTTPEEALVGALGELSEDTHSESTLARTRPDWVEGSDRDLAARLGRSAVCDPLTLGLPAGSDYDPARPLTWFRATRHATGEPVLVPIEFVAISRRSLGGISPLITPITNGQGAGTTPAMALAHGLLELLQRDGNGLRFRALDRGVVLDLDAVADPSALALIALYRSRGIAVLPKLASTEFGLTNLYVVGSDDDPAADLPIKLTACGEAAHPDRDRALRKALLEFGAARSRKAFMHGPLDAVALASEPGYLDGYLATLTLDGEEPRALAAMVDWIGSTGERLRALLGETVFSERSIVPFSSLPTVDPASVADAEGRLNLVAGRLAGAGLDILYADVSPPGGEVFARKAIVPGLEVETMSYRRIGERGVAKLLAEGSPLVGLGPIAPGSGRLKVRLTAEAEERLGGPAWLDPAAVDAAVGPHYPLYREPSSHAAQVALGRSRSAVAAPA